MRLTSLEVKGFKSFGDKVTIHFDKGVTSIVGPNGSGKSNVVDAIRWVLGEQKTRMLRSEKMENIIFNGTKNRKPANMAEVNLTFENNKGILPSEYSIVTITRRLYRTGESEYLLNNVACRLKDINNLFMDTGIGPDSYAIIELKMVDEILNDRNNTIQNLLEEAAGISKYKLRKKQTFARLEDTNADLNRVRDLLFEIEKSMKQLEAQARKANRYKKMKEEYKEVSLAYSCYAVREFREKLQELRSQEEKAQDDKLKVTVDLDVMEARIQELKNESVEKEQDYSSAQKEINELILNITRSETELKNIRDKVQFLHEKQTQIKKQNETDLETIDELTAQIEQLKSDSTAEEETLSTLESQLNELKQNVEENKSQYQDSLNELKELNQNVHELRQQINMHETEVAVKDARSRSIAEEIRRLEEKLSSGDTKLSGHKDELQRLIPEQEELRNKLSSHTEKRAALDNDLSAAESRIRTLNVRLADEKRSFDVKSNEYDLTKRMIERMEGFPESIKFLKSKESPFHDAPLVSEIITCKDEYKVAVENFLEPFLNHFVVSTGSDAWSALQRLNDSKKGRAHFFVLDQFSSDEHASRTQVSGSLNAIDLVDYDPKYSRLIQHLLGHVYISVDENITQQDTSGYGKRFVLLSRSGQFLRQRYSMGGGSLSSGDGRRTGRLHQLEKLEKAIQEHEENVNRTQTELEKAEQDHSELKQKISALSAGMANTESELARVSGNIKSIENNIEFITTENDVNSTTISQLKEELRALESGDENHEEYKESKLSSYQSELENYLEQQKIKQESSNELQHHVSEMTNALNHKNIQFFQQQNKIQNIARDISYKENQISTLTQNREEQQNEIGSIGTQLESLHEHEKELNSSLEELVKSKSELEESVRIKEEDYYRSKGLIDKEEKTVVERRRIKENSDHLIHNLQNEINDYKLKLNSLQERLSIEFNIEIEELLNTEPDPEKDPAEMKDRSDELRAKLNNFGPINPMALESYSEIEERYNFITKEKADLEEARESLLKTIEEIDQTANEQYMIAYQKVRENFISVFRTLFSEEDNCDLILTDISNPLESDIQIIAQPKGKKPLSIQQLSGGEKTLTATALLFGVYLLKPSPFCIFDEVDAPLDDANIDKFNKIIQKFSEQSQFIIITHNKKTMAATDIMYGVTMVEQGVTQMVPVDLREYA